MQNFDKKTNEPILTGKVELEIELLPLDEAVKNPVGHGREPPHGLPPPKRPDTSFQWFFNPLRSARFCLKIHRKHIVGFGLTLCLIVFVVLAIYSVPGYVVKKVMHA